MVSYKSVTMRAAIFWWLQRIDVNNVFTLIKICSICLVPDQVSNFILNDAFSGQT